MIAFVKKTRSEPSVNKSRGNEKFPGKAIGAEVLPESQRPAPPWHEGFLAMLPTIRRQASRAFRRLPPHAREEAVGEVVASSLVAYVALWRRGKVELAFPTVLADFAAAQFRAGRRVGARTNSGEVLAEVAQRRHGFTVEQLDPFDGDSGDWVEATLEDRRTPVPEQAAFRIDFPNWLATHAPRNRRIAETLAVGHSTRDTAERFGVSSARVSQLRRAFDDSWKAFHGEKVGGESLA